MGILEIKWLFVKKRYVNMRNSDCDKSLIVLSIITCSILITVPDSFMINTVLGGDI